MPLGKTADEHVQLQFGNLTFEKTPFLIGKSSSMFNFQYPCLFTRGYLIVKSTESSTGFFVEAIMFFEDDGWKMNWEDDTRFL